MEEVIAMDRREKALEYIDRSGKGLEIGPSYSPLAPKHAGFDVDILDHLDRDRLVEKYSAFPVDVSNIEEVDYVWKGERYASLTGKRHEYDWIIASHVIEHTPDLIRFLSDCDDLLKPTGVLSLQIPDKRYCFDRLRPITGLSQLIEAFEHQNTRHTPGTLSEYFLNIVSMSGQTTWSEGESGPFEFLHAPADAAQRPHGFDAANAYVDAHAWVFVPHSFRLLIHDLNLLGYASLKEVAFRPTAGCEFFVTLGRNGGGPGLSRLELLKEVEREQESTRDERPRLATRLRRAKSAFASWLRRWSSRRTPRPSRA